MCHKGATPAIASPSLFWVYAQVTCKMGLLQIVGPVTHYGTRVVGLLVFVPRLQIDASSGRVQSSGCSGLRKHIATHLILTA